MYNTFKFQMFKNLPTTKIEGKEFNKACSQMVGECPLFLFFPYLSRFLELPPLGSTMKAHISPGKNIAKLFLGGESRKR